MASLSAYLRDKLADHVLRSVPYSAPATLYVSLHTANPTDTGLVGEVTGGGYARSTVPATALYWTNIDGVAANNVLIPFPGATAAWGVVSHFGVWDAANQGNLLIYSSLSSAKAVDEGNSLVFPVSFLTVIFS
jgi:hypothetical protein